MNDFTKQELLFLLKCSATEYGEEFESICEKLMFMIENYCEHKDEE